MADKIKPVFKKAADSCFKGDDAAYDAAVWEIAKVAGPAGVDADWARPFVQNCGFSSNDLITANRFLFAPK